MSSPKSTQKILDKGFVLLEKSQFEPARKQFEQVLEEEPGNFDAVHQLGTIAVHTKQWNQALRFFNQAIAINPQFADVYSNRSVVLHELGRFDEALSSVNQAIALEPKHLGAYCNRGVIFRSLKQIDNAIASCDEAIQIEPQSALPRFNRSLYLLLSGNFAQGWEDFEWRWKTPSFQNKRYPFHQPQWLGHQSLRGKTILLQAEQGFGDTLQMCRYIPKVQALGARVVMDIPPALRPFLMQIPNIAHWVQPGETFPDFDYYCHLMSLPLAFETRLETIPTVKPYLVADAAKLNHWKAKLGKKNRKWVGLVWSGSSTHLNDHNRSIELQHLVQYLSPSLEYICLQKELRDNDIATLQQTPSQPNAVSIRYFCDDIVDFSDTAALCELMDVVISVDTSVAHLAGVLGKPTWILLPYAPDWRWLLDRNDSPWYPTVTLYRQSQPNDWGTVLKQVADDLQQLANPSSHPRTSWPQRFWQLIRESM